MDSKFNRTATADDYSGITIPSSLRTIQPFLDDALKFVRNSRRGGPNSLKLKKVALSCINHAFKLNSILNIEIDADDIACLEEFTTIRTNIFQEMMATNGESLFGFMDGNDFPSYSPAHQQSEEWGTHELLITEADTVLLLADEQYELGFKFDAMLNYHTSCVFYRVMETMIPSKANSIQHSSLMHAAHRIRQCSTFYQNFVRENFTGGSCSEIYEVHGSSKLGKGSYGSVYLATHRVTGDERAVKVMNVDRITSYYLRKLHIEMAILKTLDHPNIIKIQDVFFGKRSVYIVTDLCRGGELFELLNSGKNQGFVFREDRASKLMRDMFSAVNYLHENGIVHRDLKLENFLFEDHNSNSPLILIDFGLSRHFNKQERLTQKVGSCYYTAPEVLNGNYDHRCDVWSLGVLCYMLLSGSPPFFGKSVEDVYNSILNKEASFTDKKFKLLSNSCMDFMKRLLVRDVRYRMTTTDALKHPFITGAAFFPKYKAITSTGAHEADDANFAANLPSLPVQKTNQIMDSMLIFVQADQLTRVIMAMVSHSLGSNELQRFREEFQIIDRHHVGTISYSDFSHSFATSDALRGTDVKIVFEALAQSARTVTYHSYIAASMHNRLTVEPDENRLSLIFSYLDAEDKGHISSASMRRHLGDDVPTSDIDSNILEISGSKYLSKDDLLRHWKKMWSGKMSAGSPLK